MILRPDKRQLKQFLLNSYRFGSGGSPANPDAASIYANLVAWWDFEQNSIGTQFFDSFSTNHLSSRDGSGALATSGASTATGKVGRGFLPAVARTPYIPRANTALDAPNSNWSFVVWVPVVSSSLAATARFLAGRIGSGATGSQWILSLDGTTNNFQFSVYDNASTAVSLNSTVSVSSGGHKLIACSFDRTNNLIRIRLKDSTSDINLTAAFANPLYTTASTSNFCFNGGMSADGTLFTGGRDCPLSFIDCALYRSGVTTEAEFQYLWNSGNGKNFISLVSDKTTGGTIPTAIEAYSTGVTGLRHLKRKWSGYLGPCIRIRRSSDSTEQDINFASSAVDALVDTAAAVAFCGAGNGFVSRIYDQSGNGNDWIQATASKQPQAVGVGTWNGFVYFDSVDDSMASVNNSGSSSVYHMCAMFTKRSWGAGTDSVFMERGTALGGVAEAGNAMTYAATGGVPWRLWKSASSGNYAYNGNAAASGATQPAYTKAVWAEFDYTQSVNTASMRQFIGSTVMTSTGNATTGTVGTGTVGSAVKWFLGARNNASFFTDMNWFGDLTAEGAISDANKATMQAILER